MGTGWKYLDDYATADIAFEAYGKSLDEVFKHAMEAMVAVTFDLKKLDTSITKKVTLEEDDPGQLLIDFLEEGIFLKDTELFIAKDADIKIKKNKTYKLQATLKGDKVTQDKQKGPDVKAVTYHGFKLEEKDGKWTALVLVDV